MLQAYLSEIQRYLSTNSATEHTYRPALKELLSTLLPHLTVVNEPKRERYGVPDYILMRKHDNIPVAFVEAKDLDDKDLEGRKENKEQFDRYRSSLDHIVFTNYLEFRFYENGEFIESVRIAELRDNKKIVPLKENFEKFKSLISRFGDAEAQKIVSPTRLAEIMASKARLLANVLEEILTNDQDKNGKLQSQMNAFKSILVHDIKPKDFADVYAQTITYGMFAARLHDTTPDTFSRLEAAMLIPKTNPFLRELFQYIAGFDLDERICWIVDDLAESFRATDMSKIMKGFGEHTSQNDPMIHFYEDFLAAYDPKLRKSRGVWYTPKAVVNFIVRAVDEILKNEFKLREGLADMSKIKVDKVVDLTHDKRYSDGRKKVKDTYHRVQILDPATGTGTFLAEVISQIYDTFKGNEGAWQSYVDDDLLPRLNGFELLMASYSMAHLKIDQLLTETGYQSKGKRLRIFLTNSLEQYHEDVDSLFTSLATEANEASHIKRDSPMMVILGNPPYSGISQNDSTWISDLVDEYKYIGKDYFNERKHWLKDDYVKFIRLGQYFVDTRGEGILAYINNHSFLDNPTFRGMRWNLLKSFDKIYIIDLHGNSKKKEVCPDGSKDDNVFDIQQGVSINIFIKTGTKPKNKFADVFHCDVWGRRKSKYDFLTSNNLYSLDFKQLNPTAPFYFFVPKDETGRAKYEKGFAINELMPINSSGIVSARDSLVIDRDREQLLQRIKYFSDPSRTDDDIRQKFFPVKKSGKYLPGDTRGWSLSRARSRIRNYDHERKIQNLSYRPFDEHFIYYSSDMVDWGRESLFANFLIGSNIGLVVSRQCVSDWRYVFCTKNICEFNLTGTAGRFGSGYVFPLYIYDNNTSTEGYVRRPNLKEEIVDEIARNIGLTFESEKSGDADKFAPIDLLDYVYAVLHSPAYREKYQEFLKVDFPRVPYPTSADEFRRLVEIGGELRLIHLMEHEALQGKVKDFPYPIPGNDLIEKVRWEPLSEEIGRVWINDKQYFDNIPITAWEFYIGGYQPAQKWLKDRVGRVLKSYDIFKYQRIIKALLMTDEKMKMLN